MSLDPNAQDAQPTREEIDSLAGPVIVEFGASWCGHCHALAPHVDRALESVPDIQHIRIEDGPGKRLGRSFRVKLWPTLVFMRDGQVLDQLVRPSPAEAKRAIEKLATSATV